LSFGLRREKTMGMRKTKKKRERGKRGREVRTWRKHYVV